MRIKLDRAFKICYRRVAIFRVDGSEYKPSKIVASAKILFPSLSVVGRAFA